jgi:hypothetical protein
MHANNMLFINDMPYKSLFNAIFLEFFVNFYGDNYLNLLRTILFYLESLHFFGYDVPTFVQFNPFGSIKCISCDDPKQYKILFVECNSGCKPSYCNVMQTWKWNKNCNIFLIVNTKFFSWIFEIFFQIS